MSTPWCDYPVGTRAVCITGGHWFKTAQGWKWNGPNGCGSTFPTPGADVSKVLLPDEGPIMNPPDPKAIEAALAYLQSVADCPASSDKFRHSVKTVSAAVRDQEGALHALREEVEGFKNNNRFHRGHSYGYQEAKEKYEAELTDLRDRLKTAEGALENVITEAEQHGEYNPIGKVVRLPLGYQKIIAIADSFIAQLRADKSPKGTT